MEKWYLKNNFKQLLKRKLTDYSTLSDDCGITKNTLFRIQRNNEPDPTRRTLDAICHSLKVEVARDENGIYFYERSAREEMLRELLVKDELEILELVKKMNPAQRKEYIHILQSTINLITTTTTNE
jgi:DNA-binding Xre family transcriptional regulator